MLNDLIYVCVVSDYNLPEFESCMLRKPKHIVLVVSDFPSIQQGAERLQQQLEEQLQGTVIHRPDKIQHQNFNGQSFSSVQAWIKQCLLPYLATLPSYPKACNITGGTKLSTLALANQNLNWQWLDYKGERHSLQKLCFNSQGELKLTQEESLNSALPAVVARLHSQTVSEVQPNALVLVQPTNTAAHAQLIWNALSAPDSREGEALLDLFGDKQQGLEAVWSYGVLGSKNKKLPLTLAAQELVNLPAFTEAQLEWLQQWQKLAPHSIQLMGQEVNLPSRAQKDDFKRWLSGDWLEQLAHTWLLTKLKPKTIAVNLKVNPLSTKSSTGERETDIVVHDKGLTTVIEIKTDLAPNQKVKGLLQQITSLGRRLGRTRKVLLIGPQLQQKISKQMPEVQLRCQADNVILCRNQQELLALF